MTDSSLATQLLQARLPCSQQLYSDYSDYFIYFLGEQTFVYRKFCNQTSLDQMAFLLCFPALSSCAISGMMALKSRFKQFHNQWKHGTVWLLSGIVFLDSRRREVLAKKSLVLRRG